MEQYRETIYNHQCDQSKFGYFDSWQFLATACHSLSAFIIPLSLFGSYCIIFKTPSKMRQVKWIMLNLHVWTGVLDVMVTTMITPYLFLPAACGFPVGIMAVFKISVKFQTFLGQCSIGGMVMSFMMMFENRHSILAKSGLRIPSTKFRVIYFTLNYLYAFLFMFPAYINEPDQLEAKLHILKTKISCPTPEFFDSPVYVLNLDVNYTLLPIVLFSFITLSQIIFFITQSFAHLSQISPNISKRTKDLQKKFLIGVCIQVAVPAAIILVPIAYCLMSMFSGYYNQTMVNLAIVFISLHGMSSTIVLLYINEPYRTFTVKLFRKSSVSFNTTSLILQGRPTVCI